MIMRLRTHPSERRHDDAVRKIEVSHPIWCEQRLIRHLKNSWMGGRLKGDHDFADLFRALQKAMGFGNVFKREDSSNGRFNCAVLQPEPFLAWWID
jgi:hypothetical protein